MNVFFAPVAFNILPNILRNPDKFIGPAGAVSRIDLLIDIADTETDSRLKR